MRVQILALRSNLHMQSAQGQNWTGAFDAAVHKIK